MKFRKEIFLFLIALAALAGCGKNLSSSGGATSNSAALNIDDFLPKHAQPKLPTITLWLGAQEIAAEMALTQEQEMTGMMFRTNITDQDAMIFVLPVPERAAFWMKNCPESISAAYIDPDGTILEIHHLEKNDTNSVVAASDNIKYVLETSDGWFARHNVTTGMVVRTERGTLAESFNQ
jgi:uncharacterized membrane protein (UPF0127 family)